MIKNNDLPDYFGRISDKIAIMKNRNPPLHTYFDMGMEFENRSIAEAELRKYFSKIGKSVEFKPCRRGLVDIIIMF